MANVVEDDMEVLGENKATSPKFNKDKRNSGFG